MFTLSPRNVTVMSKSSIPTRATSVCFATGFDEDVDALPPSVTHLTFVIPFDHRIDALPPSLTLLSHSEWKLSINSVDSPARPH